MRDPATGMLRFVSRSVDHIQTAGCILAFLAVAIILGNLLWEWRSMDTIVQVVMASGFISCFLMIVIMIRCRSKGH